MSASEPSSSRAKVILVVDDDLTVRLLLQQVLEAQGWRTILASGGEEALLLLNDPSGEMPDLILVDRIMRLMNGVEFKKRLDEDGRFRNVPTFFLSGLGSESPPGVEVTGSIEKPFVVKDLVARLKPHL